MEWMRWVATAFSFVGVAWAIAFMVWALCKYGD